MSVSSRPDLDTLFKNLKPGAYSITSREDIRYNCVAWANDDTAMWWDHIPGPGHYWPRRVPKGRTAEIYVRLFTDRGYANTENRAYEDGYEKVAIFRNANGDFSHVAKMLPSGAWTSKLGLLQDIEHETLEVLLPEYGEIFEYLRRKITQQSSGSGLE